jgi:dTDP-4-amino-4,6-dideoxygalactose transaminase
MLVPFVDLSSQYRKLKKPLTRAIQEVLDGTRFIHGQEVIQFEKEFSKFLGVKHCLALNSGTDALILGLRALDLPEGSEVIIPVHTFIATALGATENKLKPVFVDADSSDYGMSLSDLKKKITPKTKAIIAVHLYGQPEKIHEIQKIIKKTGRQIYLIEDACQAHGAMYKGKKVGGFGQFSAFSFYPGKNLGAYGDGGAIVTNDDGLAAKVKLLREYGQERKYHHTMIGVNSRLDTIQGAVLRVKLPYLAGWNKKRQHWAAYYTRKIKKELPYLGTPAFISDRKSIFHLYIVQADRRDELLDALNKKQVQALIHYPIPLHLQKAFSHLKYKKGDFPVAEALSDRIISLPMHPDLTKKQVDFVLHSINKFYETR